jgi:hypothetical protein
MPILSNIEGLSYGSHHAVQVQCDLHVAPDCRNVYEVAYKNALWDMASNRFCVRSKDGFRGENSEWSDGCCPSAAPIVVVLLADTVCPKFTENF